MQSEAAGFIGGGAAFEIFTAYTASPEPGTVGLFRRCAVGILAAKRRFSKRCPHFLDPSPNGCGRPGIPLSSRSLFSFLRLKSASLAGNFQAARAVSRRAVNLLRY